MSTPVIAKPLPHKLKHFFFLLLLCTAMVCGCSESEFPLAPISGTVTLDGEPLAGGVINFQPIAVGGATNPGPGSSSHLDEAGHFSLETIQGAPGAVVGTHKVKIYSYSPESPATSDVDTGPSQERVPERYNYRSTLTFDVPAAGNDQANFDLER